MGWFFGFKLRLIRDEKGELLNFMITPGDVDDRKPLEYEDFVNRIHQPYLSVFDFRQFHKPTC